MDFQSTALPTELSRQPLIKTGGADDLTISLFTSNSKFMAELTGFVLSSHFRSLQRRELLQLSLQSALSNPVKYAPMAYFTRLNYIIIYQ